MPESLAARRAEIARLSKRDGDGTALTRARTEYATAKLETYIRDVVAAAPPLSAEQRDRLAGLLRATS